MSRIATVKRETGETSVEIKINLDGTGRADINTGIGFFDHMLNNFARHGLFDLSVQAKGDLYVDSHHLIEDVGIVLGQSVKEALGDKKSIKRYGSAILPMDETLILCALDLCGRPYFVYDLKFSTPSCGYFETAMCKEFFYAVSYSAAMNLHLKMLSGENDHHIIECAFKSFAKALDMAVQVDNRIESVLSTKGVI